MYVIPLKTFIYLISHNQWYLYNLKIHALVFKRYGCNEFLIYGIRFKIQIYYNYYGFWFLFCVKQGKQCTVWSTYFQWKVHIHRHLLYVPRGNVALARIFLSSGEFDSIVSRVHLLFYNTNSEKLQWIYAHCSCHSTS